MSVFRSLPLSFVLLVCASDAHAQEAALGRYHHLLPPMPSITGETQASRDLALFGDTKAAGYVDEAPRDGIDDARAARLLALSETFSPILRRNNFTVPVDFARVSDGVAYLSLDVWQDGRLVVRDSTALLPARPESTDPRAVGPVDTLLSALIARHHPAIGRRVQDPDDRRSFVLYLDLPGFDEPTWRAEYSDTRVRDSRIYAHPFIQRDGDAYRFVIQYWFFYPFNDGPNNHEGDWEHLNVVVAWPRPGVADAEALSAADLERVLGDDGPALDSLDIGSVEYFFHESLVVLDYQQKARTRRSSSHPFEDADWLSEVVYQRRTYADGRLARHPIGYIGANPTGPDELFDVMPRFTRSYNRNPHGTYPAPGLWQRVGAMGSTERVQGSVVPHVHDDASLPWHALLADSAWIAYRADRIVLVPDWERVAPLALEDETVARRWSWLFLPMRFGFPIARSPGAGLVPHTDLGNISPEGPAYQQTWNRLSAPGSPSRYEPTVVRVALVSTTPWTGVQSGWGVLNVPIFAAGLMPGYNVFVSQLMPWMTSALEVLNMPPARTYYRGALPVRFSSVSGGLSYDAGGDALAAVLPTPDMDGMDDARPRASTLHREPALLNRMSLTLYDGRRLSVENTFDWGESRATYELEDSTGTAGSSFADIAIRELRGGFRYALLMLPGGAARLDARAGYGWMRYAASDGHFSADGVSGSIDDDDAGYLPTILPSRRWWPNTWWVGVAAEFFTPRDHWLGRTVGYGLRIESALSTHRLDDSVSRASGVPSTTRVVSSCSVVLGW